MNLRCFKNSKASTQVFNYFCILYEVGALHYLAAVAFETVYRILSIPDQYYRQEFLMVDNYVIGLTLTRIYFSYINVKKI